MKTFVPKALLMAVLMLCSAASFSQAVISTETFPNSFNNSGNPGNDGTFSGNQGTWEIVASDVVAIQVANDRFESSPRALGFKNNTANSATGNIATSPVVDLLFGGCQPSSASLSFSILPVDVDNGNSAYTVRLELFNGSAWNTAWSRTADQLYDTYVADGDATDWEKVSLNLPSSYWFGAFKYRFVIVKGATSGASNSTEVWVDNIEIATVTTGPSFPDFSDITPTKIVDGGILGGGVEVGDVYKFDNVVSSPENIYAEIKIEAIVNATVVNLDNNAEGIAQRFQPRIAPSPLTMSADREGYVQFAITFKKVSNNLAVTLPGLRYRHFDVDGSQTSNNGNNHAFRETGWVIDQTSILGNAPSALSNSNGGSDAHGNWSKVLGALTEHTGVSSDGDVYFTATYGSVSTIRFRLGYIYKRLSGNSTFSVGATGREYGTEFGCFDLRENTTLPLTLLQFSGSYQSSQALLNWITQNEENTDRFEIERSLDGKTFSKVGTSAAQGNNSGKSTYQYSDDLGALNSGAVYYRLKCIDKDGKYTYSRIIALTKDAKTKTIMSVAPNPIAGGNAVLKVMADKKEYADLRIVGLSGQIIRSQKLSLLEGINSVSLYGLDRLTPGVYSAQLLINGEVHTTKFVVTK